MSDQEPRDFRIQPNAAIDPANIAEYLRLVNIGSPPPAGPRLTSYHESRSNALRIAGVAQRISNIAERSEIVALMHEHLKLEARGVDIRIAIQNMMPDVLFVPFEDIQTAFRVLVGSEVALIAWTRECQAKEKAQEVTQ